MKGKKCDDFVKEGIKKLGNIPIGHGKHEENQVKNKEKRRRKIKEKYQDCGY